VGADLGDAAVVDDQDAIRLLDGRQTMGDDEAGAAGHQGFHAPMEGSSGLSMDSIRLNCSTPLSVT